MKTAIIIILVVIVALLINDRSTSAHNADLLPINCSADRSAYVISEGSDMWCLFPGGSSGFAKVTFLE